MLHAQWGTTEEGNKNLIRWGFQLWPANTEALFAASAQRLESAVDYADALDRERAVYLEPLMDPCTELRPMACLALSLGLAAEDNALRSHAQKGLIAAIQTGRMNVEELGGAMSRLLDTGINKFARWAKSVREAARVSPVHTRSVTDLLQRTFHGDPSKAQDLTQGFFCQLLEKRWPAAELA